MRTALDHMGKAVGAYVGGVLAQATVAGRARLHRAARSSACRSPPRSRSSIFFSDLVPLVGATIGAVHRRHRHLFADFPTATIVWVIYSIVYQQIENTLIQPQIQKRAVNVHPFIVLVAVLFGSTLLGVLGALVAIPVAAVGADRDPRVVGLPARPDGRTSSSRRRRRAPPPARRRAGA